MPSAPKKTAQTIIDSENDYLGALKGNQSGLLTAVATQFQAQQTSQQVNLGHGRIEKRRVSISHDLTGVPDFPGLKTLIRVQSERQVPEVQPLWKFPLKLAITLLLLSILHKPLPNESEATGELKTKCIMSEM